MPFKWRGNYICFYCGKSFTDYPEFKKHTNSHGDCLTTDYALKKIKGNHIEIKLDVSDISCDVCNEPFTRFEEIIDHLIGKHGLDYDKSIDTPFQEYRLADFRCLYCAEQFNYLGYLIKHVNNVHPKNCFICNDCGVTFNKKRDLTFHIRKYHKMGGYRCDLCAETLDTLLLLREHRNNAHFRHCNNCNLKFASLKLLQRHIENEHPSTDDNIKCSYCSKQLHSSIGLKLHIRKCKVKIATPADTNPALIVKDSDDQPLINKNLNQMRQNIQCVLNMSTAVPFKFFSKYTCFYCSKKFSDFDELRRHTNSEHPVCDLKSKSMMKCKGARVSVKIDVAALACKLCTLPMDNLNVLIDHLISEHQAKYDKSIQGCLEPFKMIKENIPCLLCPGRVFEYFATLLRHINSEHTNNNRICDFCGRSFRYVSNLRVHLRNAHTGACECDICGMKFNNQDGLARHKAKTHDIRNYKCPKCPEMFVAAYHKLRHLIEVHNVGSKCDYCDKMFTKNSLMRDHVRRTHLKEKNVPCSVCNEMFFDKYLLKRHMVKHDGVRKFNCTICFKAFLRRSNLRSHMDIHKKHGLV